jgi:hypothetical protein
MSCRAVVAGLGLILGLIMGVEARGQQTPPEGAPGAVSEQETSVLDRVTADSLRGHVSFLASDLLEGRGTPSRGLDLAAEYIAAQFRGAGLEPAGDDGYFQTAHWRESKFDVGGYAAQLRAGDPARALEVGKITLRYAERAIEIKDAPLVKVDALDPNALNAIKSGEPRGKVFLVEQPTRDRMDPSSADRILTGYFRLLDRLADDQAALVLNLDRKSTVGWGLDLGRLIDPEQREAQEGTRRRSRVRIPVLTIHDPQAIAMLDALPTGEAPARFSFSVGVPVERPVELRNVVGLIRGSDPSLAETFVMVTAHYDHLGRWPVLEGDQIFNGANDDASGTASVVELARALATPRWRPRRSLVFLTFFGEESGLLGSRYYARHPVVPPDKTVADINIEQVGRTDDSDGLQLGTASITGFDYSSLGPFFQECGKQVGIRVYRHERNSDGYFRASDNYALAEIGIPAHSLSVAFQFPDYHRVSDHWEKLDYANLAKVDRMIALGLLRIASNAQAPQWNHANPKATRYIEAARRLQSNAGRPPAAK